ncbi:hypothetical protein [Kamptonema sp. UHCC 0994]|uniref:hypothetical protein n=1 Tax=Kamptonema sp. UHCC 0994 TaxID=3031329 RepID=UPI0023BA12B8|nr:hypothetical protein [Kamptonema sp. UHCC 0994]MDF0554453.1 hypothetical protein [Kamptonema sp. UHCC 0994]
MKLQSDIRAWQPPASIANAGVWDKFCDRSTSASPKFAPSTWVKLFNPPTAFSFDEAWLLCQYSEDKWLAWIPDYGEILLGINEFCTPI